MRIAVEPKGYVLKLSFVGGVNMEHAVVLTKDDAQLLRELLASEEGGFFETS